VVDIPLRPPPAERFPPGTRHPPGGGGDFNRGGLRGTSSGRGNTEYYYDHVTQSWKMK